MTLPSPPPNDWISLALQELGLSPTEAPNTPQWMQFLELLRRAPAPTQVKSTTATNIRNRLLPALDAIDGCVEVLQKDELHHEANTRLQSIRDATRFLSSWVANLESLSQLDSEQIRATPENVHIDDLVDAVCLTCLESAEKKHLVLDWEIVPTTPAPIVTDPNLLTAVLTELISNAIQFTETGSISVLARVTPSINSEHADVSIQVSDTGSGIPAWQRERLLRGDTHGTDEPALQGIGMALVRARTAALGGSMEVRSNMPVGTEFTLRLVCPIASETSPVLNATESLRPDINPVRSRHTILVVDDDDANRFLAMRMAEVLGCNASGVATGTEALGAMLSEPYDVVLLDYSMPNLTGPEVARQFRALEPRGQHLCIIGMTAFASPSDRERGLQSGMDDYLSKPVSLDRLAEVLRRYVPIRRPTVRPSVAPRLSLPVEQLSLDLQTLIELASYQRADRGNEINHLCEIFLEDVAQRVQNLRTAIRKPEPETIAREAHALRGVAGSFGAKRLATLADRLERSVSLSSRVHLTLLSEMEAEAEEVRTQVLAWLQSRVAIQPDPSSS